MIKFVKSESQFFTDWTDKVNGIRITFDKSETGYYKYQVQSFNGKVWNKVKSFHTLREAKNFCKETV